MAKQNGFLRYLACVNFAILVSIFCASQVYAETFDVHKFGAKGDGKTDDTAALKAAVAAANAVPGSVLLFPEGVYLYADKLTPQSITLQGETESGLFNSVLDATSSSAQIVLLSGLDNASKKTAVDSMRLTTRVLGVTPMIVGGTNFAITRNQFKNVSNGIQVDSSNNSEQMAINLNRFDDVEQQAIRITNSMNILLSHDEIHAKSQTAAVQIASSSNIVVDGCYFACPKPVTVQSCNHVDVNANAFFSFVTAYQGQSNQNISIQKNIFTGTSRDFTSIAIGISETSSTVLTASTNDMKVVTYGFKLSGVGNANINSDNSVRRCSIGIQSDSGNSLQLSGKISDCSLEGIKVTGCTGSLAVNGSTLADCGKSATASDPAVLFVDCPSASGIQINRNTYSGNEKDLKYFIWCVQPSPPAVIQDNLTNTMLPNRIGS